MARQRGTVTYNKLSIFKADTIVDQQVGDVVQIENVLDPGVTHIARDADVETPDDVFTIRKTNDTSKTFWASSVNNKIADSLNIPIPIIIDNIDENVSVTVPGVGIGKAYKVAVISGLPTDVILELDEEVSATNTLTFNVFNNSGATLIAGNIVVNVYEIK